MDSMPNAVLMAALVALLAVLFYRYRNKYSYWQRKGIKGPRPYYVVGHLIHLFLNPKIGFTTNCIKKYGRVFGIYEGIEPVLVIAEPELLRQICIKDFEVFPNHKGSDFLNDTQKRFIFFARDGHWRKLRALMSPTFTSGKMRRMVKLLDRCVDDLVAAFGEQIDSSQQTGVASINVKDVYSLYTMDAVTSCCYAIKLERVKDATDLKSMARRNEFVRDAMVFFELNYFRLSLIFFLNRNLLKWLKFTLTPNEKLRPILTKNAKLIASRRETKQKFEDYLQLLLDARLGDAVELDELDLKENHHAALTNESIKSDQDKLVAQTKSAGDRSSGFMEESDILANAMSFMAVGLETTANLLSSCTYCLAFHQEAQDKLRDEIRAIAKFDDSSAPIAEYESLTCCQYLDSVISETLRLLPPVVQVDRHSCQDYYIEKLNLTLPKDSKVSLRYEDIMRDEQNWPEPLKFKPERFMPENRDKIVPGSYCPFGLGPRHCLGMRFSLTESKLALAKLILKFKFTPAPNTRFPPETKPTFGIRRLKSTTVNIERLAA